MGGMGDLVETVCWVHLQACNRVSPVETYQESSSTIVGKDELYCQKEKAFLFQTIVLFFLLSVSFLFHVISRILCGIGNKFVSISQLNFQFYFSFLRSKWRQYNLHTIVYKNEGKSLFLEIMKTSVII